ncbi:MAG TPA: DUF1456 family protein [Methylophaga aminisulfidivorans]|uniref:DUF1456 family protein n=2 Tax=root TaxID=1 RepID=A0A7C1ZUJ9_9GAMM|nr:DUF1456 family protein [Methylophaga aminisulfidivorans]
MTNNDVLRRIRYTLDFNDSMMIKVFAQADAEVSREQVSQWLKRDDDPDYKTLIDKQMATFLNGLINLKRGKKEGDQPKPEKSLNNNIILRKLKIAFDLQSDDIIELLELVGFRLSKHELSAFFRKPDHKHFRVCKDQVLRNFLHGLQLKYRPDDGDEEGVSWAEVDENES